VQTSARRPLARPSGGSPPCSPPMIRRAREWVSTHFLFSSRLFLSSPPACPCVSFRESVCGRVVPFTCTCRVHQSTCIHKSSQVDGRETRSCATAMRRCSLCASCWTLCRRTGSGARMLTAMSNIRTRSPDRYRPRSRSLSLLAGGLRRT